MRIISQNSEIDINYDNFSIGFAVEEDNYLLLADMITLSEVPSIKLGTFKTKEKTLSAMEKIRNAYAIGNHICIIPKDE